MLVSILKKQPARYTLSFLGFIVPLLVFLFNATHYITSYKAAMPAEIYTIQKKGEPVIFYRTSVRGNTEAFNMNRPNYYSLEDQMGQGRGYIKNIFLNKEQVANLQLIVVKIGHTLKAWNASEIKSTWATDGEFLYCPIKTSVDIPIAGESINYTGNGTVLKAVLIPSILFSIVLVCLILFLLDLSEVDGKRTSELLTKKLLQSSRGKLLLWSCVLATFGFYLHRFFSVAPIIDYETTLTFSKLANHGAGFWSNIIPKSFNLSNVEGGGYRPRALGLIIGYTDTNLMVAINDVFPGIGPRHPLVPVAAGLVVLFTYLIIKEIQPATPAPMALLAGSSLLLFENFQVSSFVYLRSAKLIGAACILLIFYFYLRAEKNSPKKFWTNFCFTLLLFLLATIDEQVLAVLLFITLLLLIEKWFFHKSITTLPYWISSLILYFLFHLFIGPALFQHYTPEELGAHQHTLTRAFPALYPTSLGKAGEVQVHLLHSLFSNYILLLVAFFVTAQAWSKLDTMDKIRSSILFCFSFFLTAIITSTHTPTYQWPDLWNSAYFVGPALLSFITIVFVVLKARSTLSLPSTMFFCFIFIAATILFNSLRSDEFYQKFAKFNDKLGEMHAKMLAPPGQCNFRVKDPADFLPARDVKYFSAAGKRPAPLYELIENR